MHYIYWELKRWKKCSSDYRPQIGESLYNPSSHMSSISLDPLKETCRLIRLARNHRKAHRNAACRLVRGKAIIQYEQLSPAQKNQIPQQLRVRLRYRSEKYFGNI